MKAVILAGGLGTRLSEETVLKPKPMVEIGGRSILWHIMKIYSAHGINEFIVCCGYKGHLIKEYFANYFLYMSDVTFIRHRTTRTKNCVSRNTLLGLVFQLALTAEKGWRKLGGFKRLPKVVRGVRFQEGIAVVDPPGKAENDQQKLAA